MRFELEAGGRRHRVDARRTDGGWLVTLDGRSVAADVARAGDRWSLLIGDRAAARGYDVFIERSGPGERVVHVGGTRVLVSLASRPFGSGRAVPGRAAGAVPVLSSMPGRVVAVLVTAGDEVQARQGLAVVEAMKMENELRAPKAGTVKDVRVAVGALVEAGAVLMVIE